MAGHGGKLVSGPPLALHLGDTSPCVLLVLFLVVLHDDDGITNENLMLSCGFARAPFGFLRFFDVFAHRILARLSPMDWRDFVPCLCNKRR